MAAGLATGKHRAYVGGTLAANPLSCLAGYVAIKEIERTNACEIAGRIGATCLCDGLKALIEKYGLPFVAYKSGFDRASRMHGRHGVSISHRCIS